MKNYQGNLNKLIKCEDEPIQHIGRIQAHGCLLVLEKDGFKILQCSKNIKAYLRWEIHQVLNKSFISLLPKNEQSEVLRWLKDMLKPHFSSCILLTLESDRFYLSAHLSEDYIILELEPFFESEIKGQITYDNFIAQTTQKITLKKSLYSIAQIVVDGLQKFLDYDRVKIFQYDEDYSGSVIAESTKENIKSYLNHHFPQSDIPKQAREMLKKKYFRQIPNVMGEPIDIIPYLNPKTQKPVSLILSELRNPSEIHLEYLTNMNVKATFTISIIVEGELWGLICCQNETTKKYIPYSKRKVCENLGFIFAQSIQRANEYTDIQKFDEFLQKEYQVIQQVNKDLDLIEGALGHELTLLDLNGADGVVISYNEQLIALGKTPDKPFIKSILHWLQEKNDKKVFNTRHLSKYLPEAEKYAKTASGILSLEISRHSQEYIVWFKPEVVETVTWGGNPHKEIEKIVDGQIKISPRTTFDSWIEKSHAKSPAWENYEIKVAEHFRNDLLEVMKLKNTHLEKANQKLQIALEKEQQLNEELASAEEELRQTYQFQAQIVKKLSLSETQLKAIYNTTTDSNFLIGTDYKIISFNREAARQVKKIFGEDVRIGDDMREFSDPNLLDEFKEHFQQTVNGETIHVKRKITHQNKNYWYKVSYYPVYNIEEEIWAVSFNSTDITKQTLAQQEAEKLALVAKYTDNSVIITDKNGFIEWVNEGFIKSTGYKLKEAKGKKPGAILQGKDTNPNTVRQIAQAIKEQKVIQCEILNYTKHGEEMWINLYIQPILDKEGNLHQFFAIQLDITENKRQEAIIRKSGEEYKRMAEQYRLLADNTTDLITKHEIDSTYLYLSPSVYNLLGYKEEELIGRQSIELFYPEDIPKAGENIVKALEGKNIQFSYRMIRKDGGVIWVETTGRVLFNQGEDKATHLLTITRDISEKMRMSKLLDDTSRVAKVGGWEISLLEESLRPKWTDETYRIHELPLGSEIDIDSAINFYHPDDREIVTNFVNQLINEGKTYEFELRLITAKGKEVWVKAIGNRELINGKATRIYGTFQDISESKRIRTKLLDATKRLGIATKSAQIGVWDWDIADNILTWDEQMYKLYGVDSSNFEGAYEAWERGLHPKDSERASNEVQLAINGEKNFDTEFRVITPKGEIRHLRAFAEVIFNEDGKSQRMIGVNWDITKEKENEKALILEKERAEELNRLKTNFLANMSHEIRTPINGILGLSQVIKDESDVKQIYKYVDLQYQSGKRLLNTITSILQLSRLEASTDSFSFKEVNINQVLDNVVKSLNSLAQNKGIYLTFESLFENLTCLGDENLLHQIFNNIIGNAIKFTNQGEVKVFVEKDDKNGRYLRIYVKDTGIGISEDFLPQIFNSFQQESTGLGRQFEGSGLGLSIAKKYIELLEGKIEVKSKKGEGSTFIIYLLIKN